MPYPKNYRYTREHEWIELDGKIGTIGITDYAQNSLGDIVYVDVPKVGDSVTANATFGSVESVKAVSDLYSPVSVPSPPPTTSSRPPRQDQRECPRRLDHQSRALEPRRGRHLLDAAAYEAFIPKKRQASLEHQLIGCHFSPMMEARQISFTYSHLAVSNPSRATGL